jgi:glutathione S-transferase
MGLLLDGIFQRAVLLLGILPLVRKGRLVRLYHRWKCPWCAAARQGIENVGADVDLVEVPYPREERSEVLALSGQPRVPVLVDGEEVIVGSRRIVRHLYERYGGEFFVRSAAELAQELGDPEGLEELDACAIGPREEAVR